MEEKKEERMEEKLTEQIDKKIKGIIEQGIQTNNIDFLGKVIDIKKDLTEMKKEEEEMMYGNYGRGSYRAGGSYGEYNEGGSYGRRGVPGSGSGRARDSQGRFAGGRGSGRYRGEEMMDEMMYHYGNYSEGREQYGADGETLESFKYMLKSFKDYYKHLKQEASSQQEVQMLEDVAREISEM